MYLTLRSAGKIYSGLPLGKCRDGIVAVVQKPDPCLSVHGSLYTSLGGTALHFGKRTPTRRKGAAAC